ncbi:MAG: Na+ dependent nucleoside transporter [Marinilabiliales bacterium]|nr:MAG: Na+ dependent nucleoside transporter [Marinilabiliales bacterium]
MIKKFFKLVALLLIGIVTFSNLNAKDIEIEGEWKSTTESDQISFCFTENNLLIINSESISDSLYYEFDGKTILINKLIPKNYIKVDSIGFIGDGNKTLVFFNDHKILQSELILQDTLPIPGFEELAFSSDTESKIQITYEGQTYVLTKSELKTTPKHEPKAQAGFTLTSMLRGLLGMIVLIFIAWIFSTDRKKVSWRVVGIGLGAQVLLAIGVLKVPFIQAIFEFVGKIFVKILNFSGSGAEFLLGGLLDVNTYGYIFAFQILPTIIFFSALTSVLFYLGIIQKVVYGLAWVMTKAMKISGAESLSVAGNIFLGQTESPLMIKAYLEKMNKSEILLVMIGGMATVAGGVLAAYIGFLGGDDPVMRLEFAKHLLAASVMAAPGAVVVSKILCPQTEPVNKDVTVSKEKVGSNFLDAMSNGTTEGLKLAANVAAMLLVFVAFIAMFNFIVGKIGIWTNLNPVIADFTNGQYDSLSLEFILGYAFAPLMWLIGVGGEDITLVGRLLGEKLIMSEFIGYISLAELKASGIFAEQKSIIMATYMLCGFANFASIGIQIGGIGSLAPNQRKQLSKFGMRALLGGSLSSLLSATIVGIIMG